MLYETDNHPVTKEREPTIMGEPSYLGRLLIVDDDEHTCKFWGVALSQEGFRVDTAHNLEEMKDVVRRYSIDAVLLDLKLGPESGLDGLPFLVNEAPFCKVFILTANASVETAVEAMGSGATGYITKDTKPADIAIQIKRHLVSQSIENSSFTVNDFAQAGLIGCSKSFQDLCCNIEQLKDVDSTILVLGESGTGKEVVARTLHKLSKRSQQRFEAINCAAIPDTLLESELFGHKRGAFTDAKMDRKGIFELCSEGTLLLDEIGDMPLTLQTKLLRVLQEKEVVPVGSSTPIKINTRVIAATHRDLLEEIENGRFREDLYYRLSVVPMQIPPLRHRKADIPALLEGFIKDFSNRFEKKIHFPNVELMRRLMAYDWPGNIRELRNAIERACILTRDGNLHIEDIFHHLHRATANQRQASQSENENFLTADESIMELPLTQAKQAFEKVYIERMLRETNGNVTETSKRSGRYRADIYKLLEKYDLTLEAFRS